MKRALLLATALATLPAAAGQPAISNAAAVRAIIGEAGNQSDDAMFAVASALRNRETLQGVYGVNNPVIALASAELRARVQHAWLLSAQRNGGQADPSLGCKFFGRPADAPYFLHTLHFRPVKTIGQMSDHVLQTVIMIRYSSNPYWRTAKIFIVFRFGNQLPGGRVSRNRYCPSCCYGITAR